MSFHAKIKESAVQVQVAQQKVGTYQISRTSYLTTSSVQLIQVRTEYATAAVRKQLATEVLNALKTEIENREKLLFELRKAIMDSFINGAAKAQPIPQPQPVVYVG